ncbi:hypothetical protein N499_0171 [Wolbachia pipientis wVitA]|nr:hypothetical protein N499_0171 [Wolbachia pipientis wVitA]
MQSKFLLFTCYYSSHVLFSMRKQVLFFLFHTLLPIVNIIYENLNIST